MKKHDKGAGHNLPSIDIDAEWQRIRICEAELQDILSDFIINELDPELIAEARQEFTIFGKYPADMLQWDTFFAYWLYFNYFPHSFDEVITIAQTFLVDHPDRLTPYQKRFIQAAAEAPFTFYLVEDVIPERRLVLQDILLQKSIVVKERTATLYTKRGVILFGRAVELDGQSILLGLSPFSLPNRCYTAALELRQNLQKAVDTPTLTSEHLVDYDFELREAFFALYEHAKQPPNMINDDKDKIVLHDLVYELTCSAKDAFEKLKTLCPEKYLKDILEQAVTTGVFNFPWAIEDTMFAELTIEGSSLKIFTNSVERTAKIQKELQERLGSLAILKDVHVLDPAERMRKIVQEHENGVEETPAPQKALQTQGQMKATKAIMDKHWQEWLDSELPILGGITPRAAANTKNGREILEGLFLQLDMRNEAYRLEEDTLNIVDVDALRRALGIACNKKK